MPKRAPVAPWKAHVIATLVAEGCKTVGDIAARMDRSTVMVQDCIIWMYEEGYLARTRHVDASHRWYEYRIVKMPPIAAPPASFYVKKTKQENTFGPDPLRPVLDALGWVPNVPTGTHTVSRRHVLDI